LERSERVKKYTFTVLIEKDEDGGFIGHVPELRGCHSQGDSMVELMANIDEAIKLCLEVAAKDGINVFNLDFVETKLLDMVMS
jgi:predicted RNase H-like HicB family nuclease